jgi:hypothetical protein
LRPIREPRRRRQAGLDSCDLDSEGPDPLGVLEHEVVVPTAEPPAKARRFSVHCSGVQVISACSWNATKSPTNSGSPLASVHGRANGISSGG